MSEEEIIKYLKECIEHSRYNFENFGENNYLDKSTQNAIQGLLDLYEKEKQEKEKFKKALGKRITYCNELEKDLFENCSKYVISKDKIREIIKHLEKEQEENRKNFSIGIELLSNKIIDKFSNKIIINFTIREYLEQLIKEE